MFPGFVGMLLADELATSFDSKKPTLFTTGKNNGCPACSLRSEQKSLLYIWGCHVAGAAEC